MPPSSPLLTAGTAVTGEHRPAPSPARAVGSKALPAQPWKIPLSVYAPVPLARPLSVFGEKFEVHLSASCTLSMNTVMQTVTDTSLLTFLRTEQPALLQHLKTLHYAGSGKHRPSATTRKRIRQDLKLLDSDAVSAILNGQEPPPFTHQSEWRVMLLGMNGGGDDFLRDMATDLIAWDDQALQIRELTRVGENAQAYAVADAMLDTSQVAWEALNPRILQAPQVLIVVESSLQVLARLVCRIDMAAVDLPSRESWVTQLLGTGRRPLGHWLHDVQRASGCTSLPALAQRLLSAGARHHKDRPISYDLLKKWSSAKQVAMPQTAVKPVLWGVRHRERAEMLEFRYYVARFLTFLCDLTCAGIPGQAPVWADIQAQIKNRYSQVYRQEAADWPAAPSTA